MGDPLILNNKRLPIAYEINGGIPNIFAGNYKVYEDESWQLLEALEQNLGFAASILMKWKGEHLKLAPFQTVVLEELWHKTFPVLLCSRGAGKSFILAVYAILTAVLVPGSKIVIVAASFRQSKIVFDYIKQIHDFSPIIQQAVSKIRFDNDEHVMIFGDSISTITALPLGNGEKIRGKRASVILCDEYASIPEEVFQVVVRGFAAVSADPIRNAEQIALEEELISKGLMKKEDRSKRRHNKIIYTGTASYQFNHFYRLYRIHRAIIESKFVGDANSINDSFALDEAVKMEGHLDYRDYSIIQLPYTALPRGFMDDKQIAQAYATMPRALFQMEYECQFPTDSDGFFKRSVIDEATPDADDGAFPIELKGDQNYEYVMGIDPARKSDNFAISILKIIPGKGAKNVYCWTLNNKNFVTCVRKIRDLMSKFKIVRIAMDSMGGGVNVEDLLQNIEIVKGDQPIWRCNDEEHAKFAGLHILDMVNFSPAWIGEANYGLLADIEHKRMLFPRRIQNTAQRSSSEEEFLEEDEVWAEIDTQIAEMCMIVVTATKTGVQHFDLPEIPGTDKSALNSQQRKDRYSALLLSAYAARSYVEEGQMEISPSVGDWADFI